MTTTIAVTNTDLDLFQRFGIGADVLDEAGVRRVSDAEARDVGILRSGRLEGILFPYWKPTGEIVGYRLRRDHPEVDPAGKPKAKYLSSFSDRRHFYVLPSDRQFLHDTSVPVVFVEAEKSKLAVTTAVREVGRGMFAIGLGGCYGWTGKIGIAAASDGERVDVKGPLPDFEMIRWSGRVVVICLDSNVETNPRVRAAEVGLARELTKRGATVRLARIPYEPNINGPDDYIAAHGQDAFLRLLDNASEDAWPEPKEIRAELRPVESMPPALIPEQYRDWLTDISERMGCPLDFLAIGAIVVTGSVIGAGCGIRPKQCDDWTVVPNLWGGVVGRPSLVLKTPALQEVMKPLERLTNQSREAYTSELKEYEAESELFKARKEAAKGSMRDAVRGGQSNGRKPRYPVDAAVAKAEYLNLEEPPAPKHKRFKTNDATVEKLGELLADNPRGLMVFRDELIGLLAQWDREGREGDRAFFLEAWNGTGSHDTDRIGRGSIRIEHACVSILGGIQPSKLLSYLHSAMRGHENDGLTQRLQLLVYPDEPPATALVDRYPNTEARDRAWSVIKNLAEMDFAKHGAVCPEGGGIPYFHFDSDAQQLFYGWFDNLSKRLRADDEPIVIEHLGKFRKLMPSLSLIFHLIEIGGGTVTHSDVPEMAARRAAAFCEYLESHARRIYGLVTDIAIEAASRLAKRIQAKELGDRFTLRDVYRKQWALLGDKEVAESACDYLIDLGWLRAQEPAYTGGRRSGVEYVVNPRLSSVSSVSAYPSRLEDET